MSLQFQMHMLQIQDDTSSRMLEIPAGREVKVVQLADGQQAISLVKLNDRGLPDPKTETIYMVKDLLNSDGQVLAQEMVFIWIREKLQKRVSSKLSVKLMLKIFQSQRQKLSTWSKIS